MMNGTRPSAPQRFMLDAGARLLASDSGVMVRAQGRMAMLRGKGMEEFLGSLFEDMDDGVLEVDPVQIDPGALPGLLSLLQQLVDVGLLIPETDTNLGDLEEFEGDAWLRAERQVSQAEVRRRLAESRLQVVGENALAELVVRTCRESGLRAEPTAAADADLANFTVVVGRHQDDPVLTEFNERVNEEESSVPWLPVAGFDGEYAFVGPSIVPGQSACYRCFLLRRASVFPATQMVDELSWARPLPLPIDGSARRRAAAVVVAGLTAEKVAEYTTLAEFGPQSAPSGVTTMSYNERGLTVGLHRVLRVPRCPVCSPARDRGIPQVWYSRPVKAETEDAAQKSPIGAR